MRTDCDVVLHLDMVKAMSSGHVFFESANGVVLTEGPLPATYFTVLLREVVLSTRVEYKYNPTHHTTMKNASPKNVAYSVSNELYNSNKQ